MPRKLITVRDARQRVLEHVIPLPAETVPLDEALGRVLAGTVRAAGDVPAFPASAMDGYAVQAGPAGRRLPVSGESRAGAPSPTPLAAGHAIRISTGAPVPEGATAVIAQERVSAADRTIETLEEAPAGQNIRWPGEDMRRGATVLSPGRRLGAVELGASAAAGLGSVIVARRPRVCVLCTGDELRAPGESLAPGQIHNSNAPMLTGLARRSGAEPDPAGRLTDDLEATRAGLATALARSDVVVVSGGVSVGPHDHVRPVLAELGVEEVFWGVALQPGKPTWFGTRGERGLVFGLPGNPVSAVVTFSLFVAPALASLQGAAPAAAVEPVAVLGAPVRRNPAREQALRVRLERGAGLPVASPNGAQGSHLLSSLLGADALAMIPAGQGVLAAGEAVGLEPLAT